MNGYITILLRILLVASVWYFGGSIAGVITLVYSFIMAYCLIRYNRGIEAIILAQRAEIDKLRAKK